MDPEYAEQYRAYLTQRIRDVRAAIDRIHDQVIAEEMAGFDIELPVVLEGRWPNA